jgi:hypothetical protein
MAFDAAKAPRDIKRAIMTALRSSQELVRGRAVGNLARVLKSRTGQLAASIYARTGQTRFGGYLQVGTLLRYGRFWEYGFMRGGGAVRGAKRSRKRRTDIQKAVLLKSGAKAYKRPWLAPTAAQSQAEVARRIQVEVQRAVGQQFPEGVTIDLNIAL